MRYFSNFEEDIINAISIVISKPMIQCMGCWVIGFSSIVCLWILGLRVEVQFLGGFLRDPFPVFMRIWKKNHGKLRATRSTTPIKLGHWWGAFNA